MVRISRRRAVQVLAGAAVGAPLSVLGQGRCMRSFGTPACNTTPVAPVFEPTGWKTVALEHLIFRVADYQKEAVFYTALMGWKLRSDDGAGGGLDMGDGGSFFLKKPPAGAFDAPSSEGRSGPVRAVVESFCFGIAPGSGKTVEAELRKRGLTPVADNDG